MNKKILAIVPARGGSKGVPRKNIKLLYGKPLIQYTLDAAKCSKYIERIIVSTEDPEISTVSEKLGAEVPFLRPQALANDSSPTIDAIIYTLNELRNRENYIPEYVCLLQCTSPLRNSNHIDEAFEKLIDTNMDAIVSVCEAEVNPYWSNVFKGNKLEYFMEEGRMTTKRQDLPEIYRMNGAIYFIKTEVLLNAMTFEPEKTTGYIMDSISSVDIDTELDFKIAEVIVREKNKL